MATDEEKAALALFDSSGDESVGEPSGEGAALDARATGGSVDAAAPASTMAAAGGAGAATPPPSPAVTDTDTSFEYSYGEGLEPAFLSSPPVQRHRAMVLARGLPVEQAGDAARGYVVAAAVPPGTLLISEIPELDWRVARRLMAEHDRHDERLDAAAVRLLACGAYMPQPAMVDAALRRLAALCPLSMLPRDAPPDLVKAFRDKSATVASRLHDDITAHYRGTKQPMPSEVSRLMAAEDGLLRLLLAAQCNGFGTGLYTHMSMFNHSCSPNAVGVTEVVAAATTDDATARGLTHEEVEACVVRANDNIPSGTAVTISYLRPLEQSYTRRRRLLRESFGFDCSCARCDGRDPRWENTESVRCSATTCIGIEDTWLTPQSRSCNRCGDPTAFATTAKRVDELESAIVELEDGIRTRFHEDGEAALVDAVQALLSLPAGEVVGLLHPMHTVRARINSAVVELLPKAIATIDGSTRAGARMKAALSAELLAHSISLMRAHDRCLSVQDPALAASRQVVVEALHTTLAFDTHARFVVDTPGPDGGVWPFNDRGGALAFADYCEKKWLAWRRSAAKAKLSDPPARVANLAV